MELNKWLNGAIKMADTNIIDHLEDGEYWKGYRNACVAAIWNVVFKNE